MIQHAKYHKHLLCLHQHLGFQAALPRLQHLAIQALPRFPASLWLCIFVYNCTIIIVAVFVGSEYMRKHDVNMLFVSILRIECCNVVARVNIHTLQKC